MKTCSVVFGRVNTHTRGQSLVAGVQVQGSIAELSLRIDAADVRINVKCHNSYSLLDLPDMRQIRQLQLSILSMVLIRSLP